MCCCPIKKLIYYGAIVTVLGYLVYCTVFVPKYRWMAATILVLLTAFELNIWRYFPCEREKIQREADAIESCRALEQEQRTRAREPLHDTAAPHAPFGVSGSMRARQPLDASANRSLAVSINSQRRGALPSELICSYGQRRT